MFRNICVGLAFLLGVGALANGLFMLLSPQNWYFAVPGVTTTGPFNQHFLRDIGLIFLLMSVALFVGVAKPQYRVVCWGAAALWESGHALFHFWEVAVGICGPSALVRDFAAVTLPAILCILLTLRAIADARVRIAPSLSRMT